MKRINWTTELVAEEMLKDHCILTSEYKNNRTPIKYDFEGKTYSVIWNHWRDTRQCRQRDRIAGAS